MTIDKDKQRQLAYQARNRQVDKMAISRQIFHRCLDLPEARLADTFMIYVSCRAEVDTLSAIQRLLDAGKRVIVPYCTKDPQGQRQLGLWRLSDLSELAPGTWGILEPPKSRWGELDKAASVDAIDFFIVPGVAFDRKGRRLGNGAGYYDRLLANVRADAVLCGVCFESQLLDEIDIEAHDIRMDYVVTEKAMYINRGSLSFLSRA